MAFNIDKLFDFCVSQINTFYQSHKDEVFYGFSIDANMLCMNSEEQALKTLLEYQARWDRETRHIDSIEDLTEEDLQVEEFGLKLAAQYSQLDRSDSQACLEVINNSRKRRREEGCVYRTEEGKLSLRMNTGDWAYQGFADMDDEVGFDSDAYDDHYELEEHKQKRSVYAKAMNKLLKRLTKSGVFDQFKKSPEFFVNRVEHDY